MTVSIENMGNIFKDAEKKCIKACINTVNIQAASSRKEGIENTKKNFTIRNQFTEKNIVFTQCPQNVTNINQIQSEVGATKRADYLERLEEGGTRKPKKGKRLAIPTTLLRGSNESLIPRDKHMTKIRSQTVGKKKKTRSRKSNIVAEAYIANKHGLFFRHNKSIYQVTSFTKSGDNINFDKKLIYNMKFSETKTPAQPWLKPATDQQAKEAQQIYNYQLYKIFIGV